MNARRVCFLSALLGACRTPGPSDTAAGTVELTETDVAPIASARVLRVLVEEGGTVRVGDTLALLTQSALPPELDARRARLSSAEAELRDLRAGARVPELERARSERRAASEDSARTRRDADRYAALLKSGSVGEAQAEAMESAARVAAQRAITMGQSVRMLEEGTRPERIRAAEAALRQARAQVESIQATAADLVLLAPIDGVVTGRHVEPGEVIAAGIPAVSLGDPAKPWVRVFVAPAIFERLRVGSAATIRISGGSVTPYRATVTSLATRAEFTPRVAMTDVERADLLFGVKLRVEDGSGRIKAGLPVTVTFAAAPPAAQP